MKKQECGGSFSEQMTVNGAGVGMLVGVIVGALTDNMGLWISLGVCFGAGIGSISKAGKESMCEDSGAEEGDKG